MHSIDDIRTYIINEFFEVPSRRRTPGTEAFGMPEPKGGTAFYASDVLDLIDLSLQHLGYYCLQPLVDPRSGRVVYARMDGESLLSYVVVRWDARSDTFDPNVDLSAAELVVFDERYARQFVHPTAC